MDDNRPTDRRRCFLIVGCGSIARRHIKNLRALGVADIVAFDPRADRRNSVASDFAIDTIDSLEAAWEREPTAVLVSAPTSLHVPLALEAALRRCHLFIEKPLSHSWEGVERLIDLVQQQGVTTLVGCNLRFHPGLATVKKLLADQAVGRVLAARVEVGQYLPDWHPQEDYRESYSARRALGGGVILDAIHELDYIRWLLGEITEVSCFAAKLSSLEIDTEDMAALLLCFQCGALGEIHLDYVQRAYSRTCQIIGEEGTIHWDYSAEQVRWYSARSGAWRLFANPEGWQANQMYVDEMAHYLRCLDKKEQPALDVAEGARVLQIALAAKASAQERRWVNPGRLNWNATPTL